MPNYMVRTIEGHDLVGIFSATNIFDLAVLIDEVVNPDLCEFVRLGPGGIIWLAKSVQVPIERNDEEEDDDIGDEDRPRPGIPWADAEFTESWSGATRGAGTRSRWKQIEVTVEDMYGIDPEAPEPEPPPKRTPRRTSGKVLPFLKRRKSS